MSNLRRAVDYRNRAELLRSIADDTPLSEHRESLKRVARYYDSLADLAEQELKGTPA